MARIWPHDTIRELLTLAEARGEARSTLDTERDAELFRFAIYSFRRQADIGDGLSVTLDGCDVVLTVRRMPEIAINGCST